MRILYFTLGLLIGITFTSFQANAQQCDKVDCSDISKEKQDCIIKKRCNPEIAKLKRKIRQLEAELAKKPKVVTETITEEVIVEKEVQTNKNSLSLVAGVSQTDLEDHGSGANTVVETNEEFDLGLMYQRDFDEDLRFSILGTINKSLLLGLGVNF